MAHTANSTVQMMSEFFVGHIASQNLQFSWTPDLSPPYFCLGRFLKLSVHKNNSHTLEEQKQNIELCISNITAKNIYWVASDMRKRVNACIAECVGLFQYLI
jgi:hypothetical protein